MSMNSIAETAMPPILLPTALSELFAQVSNTGKLTVSDRYGLLAALMDNSTTPEDLRAIDRILRAACRGKIQVSSELSTINPVG